MAFAYIIPIIYLQLLYRTNFSADTFILFMPFSLFTPIKYFSQMWFLDVIFSHQQHENRFKLREKEMRSNDNNDKTPVTLNKVITAYETKVTNLEEN